MSIFYFDIKKAVQLAARFISESPNNSMYYVKLLKLMYLADRENIIQTGYPITGDALVALERGPVLSNVLYLMEGAKHSDVWSRHFGMCEPSRIQLLQDPGMGLLSRKINGIVDDLRARFEKASVKEIVEYTHDLPEWGKKAFAGPRDIDVRDILADAHFSEENIASILAHIEETTDALRGMAVCGEEA